MNEQFFVKKVQVLEKYRTHQSVEIGSGQKPHPGSPPQKWQELLPSLLSSADKYDKNKDFTLRLAEVVNKKPRQRVSFRLCKKYTQGIAAKRKKPFRG